jgi:hypothetical protein
MLFDVPIESVEYYVGKNRAHHTTLRYAAIGGIELPFLQVAGSEKSAHEADEAMIMEALAQDIEQNRGIDFVETGANVSLNEPLRPTTLLRDLQECRVTPAFWSEPM